MWFGIGRLVAVAVAVVAVAGGGWWLLRSPPPTTESTLPYAGASGTATHVPTTLGPAASATSSPPTTTTAVVVVHVAGAVVSPGVYRLAGGTRVVDVIAAAGGLTADADGNAINLAAVLRDGQRVVVPHVGETVTAEPAVPDQGAAADTAPAGPIDVNTATAAQLDTLPGVGPSTAAAIIAYRDQHGPFQSVDEIGEVRGIGPAKLEAIRGLVTV